MAQIIATVVAVTGDAFARDVDGKLRALKAGDALHEGETVVTSAGGRVELAMSEGGVFEVAGNQTVALTPDLAEGSRATAQDAQIGQAAIDQVVQALEQGGTLDNVLEAPAAGLAGGGGGDGNNFVRLLRIAEAVDPLAFDFGTATPTFIDEFDGAGDAADDPATLVAAPVTATPLPTVTVALELGADGTTPTLTGNWTNATTVTVAITGSDGSTQNVSATLNGDGSWSADVSGLTFNEEVTYTATATASDDASNTATAIDTDSFDLAAPDSYQIEEGKTVSFGSVLANDSGPAANLRVAAVRDGSNTELTVAEGGSLVFTTRLGGTVTLNADGTFSYTAPARDHSDAISDIDSFEYQAAGTYGTTAGWTTVSIDITDSTPLAQDDIEGVTVGHSIAGNVLTNDTPSADGGSHVSEVSFNGVTKAIAVGASVTFDTPNGLLTISSDGSYTYQSEMAGTPRFDLRPLNNWVSAYGSEVSGLYGYDGAGWSFDPAALGTSGVSGVKMYTADGKSGVGVGHGANTGIENGEHLVVGLKVTADTALLSLAQMDAASAASAKWALYDASGNLVGSGDFSAGTLSSGGLFELNVSGSSGFNYVVISHEGAGANFSLADISTTYAAETFSYTVTDADGSTATADLEVRPYDSVVQGTAGNNTLTGTAGHDLIHGGAGDDVLYGGLGADVFQWKFGDAGSAGAPATDTIKDFSLSQGDSIDLRDLLQGDTSGTLDNYLHFGFDSGTGSTTIQVSSTGAFSGGDYSAADQVIVVEGVDLTAGGGSDQQIIQNLVTNGKLLAD